jgi:hypothetical protein
MPMSDLDSKAEYMSVRPAFDPQTIVVGQDGRRWVARYMPANAKQGV